jgi:hypothetical protein
MKHSFFYFSLFILFISCNTSLEINHNAKLDSAFLNRIITVDKLKYDSLIAQSNSELIFVLIISSKCGGTPGFIEYINILKEKYTKKQVDIILLSCDFVKDKVNIAKLCKKYNYVDTIYLIAKQYTTFKTKDDDRERSMSFRKAICDTCNHELNAVPYAFVYNKRKELIYYEIIGSAYKLPSDFISYFYDKQYNN